MERDDAKARGAALHACAQRTAIVVGGETATALFGCTRTRRRCGFRFAGGLGECAGGGAFCGTAWLFAPLGMQDSGFYLPAEKASRLVTVQQQENKAWVRLPVTFYDPDYPIKGAKTFFSGGAGLSSTTKDYATLLQMYLNGGELNGTRILSRTTVQFMMGNQTGSLFGEDSSYYGLAFEVLTPKGQDKGGKGSVGTFDWGGYFNTQYFADPKEGLIGILMKQTKGAPHDETAWKFRLLVSQAVDD